MILKQFFVMIGLVFIAQIIIWFQLNGQFIWPWVKENPFLISLIGLPISYILIIATEYIVAGFDGLLWPGRFMAFGLGIVSYAILTSYFMGEGINYKIMTSLILATAIICVQLFWKIN